MAFYLRNDDLFESNMALRCEVKAQAKIIDEFKSGERYLKLQRNHRKVIDGYIREIKKLRAELAKSHAETVNVRNMWLDECDEVWHEHVAEIAGKDATIRRLEEKIWELQQKHEDALTTMKLDYEEQLYEKDCIINELTGKVAHLEALLGRDSTNTNLPTSLTPPGKNKHNPNSREKNDRAKGGQPGHKKHTLEKPDKDEITDEVDHVLEEDAVCPTCGSDDFAYTGEYEEKYEYDIEIKVKKILHKYWLYQCTDCGEIVRSGIDPNLRGGCQYGAMVQALALSLMTTSNTAINKVPVHLSGITNGEISPCEGYVAKLMPRAAKLLAGFMEELYKRLIMLLLVYWDDTVVMADKKRICLRFYGDERIAYYVAHDKKDLAGVLEDGVLSALPEGAMVMHDHSSINYNEKFVFENIECNAHLQRDLQKIIDETGHSEPRELKELITKTIKERNELLKEGKTGFDRTQVELFEEKLADILRRAEKAAEGNTSQYSGPFERAVIRRLWEYGDNYFAWVKDFRIPTTNNLSERALRGVKTKMKVSGQFASSKTANNYAVVRSYIETCRRNGLNEISALSRLCSGNPYTIEEIFSSA